MVTLRLVVCCMVVAAVIFDGKDTALTVVATCIVTSSVVTVRVVVEGVVMVTVVS